MRLLLAPLRRIGYQLLFLLVIYFISRCCFTLINLSHFEGLSLAEFLYIALRATRFDIAALLAVNSIYIVLSLLPLPLWKLPAWNRGLQVLFVITNLLALLFDISDWAYYPYNFKRATADVLDLIGRKGDFLVLLPGFLLTYWYVPLAVLLLLVLLIRSNRRICLKAPVDAPGQPFTIALFAGQLLRLVVVAGLCVIGIRGGLQYIPIGIRNAVQVTDSKYAAIVLNTPFSIMTSFTNNQLTELHYFSDAAAAQYVPTRKQYNSRPFRKKNVMIIVLESFSKEFTGIGGGKSYTPFLDSLMQHSLVCRNAYANALRSAEGIPAVLAGIPSLQDEPFATSLYGTDRISSLPRLLGPEGYSSAFYHGGTNGTMSFDVFTANAGYRYYRGRNEYHNEKDYDGNWGIWDEPFLQYTVRDISATLQQPFCAALFTLSSHPPYKIPAQHKDRFPRGPLQVQECVGYTDYALRRFFAAAESQDWYRNTLFVITADHCSPASSSDYYQGLSGRYAIPVVFFAPGDHTLSGHFDELAQQLDIIPSVLDYLGYPHPFFAFGNSIFTVAPNRFVINQQSGVFSWTMGDYLLQANGDHARSLYDLRNDSLCRNSLLPPRDSLALQYLQYVNAFRQVYNKALIKNGMWLK